MASACARSRRVQIYLPCTHGARTHTHTHSLTHSHSHSHNSFLLLCFALPYLRYARSLSVSRTYKHTHAHTHLRPIGAHLGQRGNLGINTLLCFTLLACCTDFTILCFTLLALPQTNTDASFPTATAPSIPSKTLTSGLTRTLSMYGRARVRNAGKMSPQVVFFFFEYLF